jgi:hypothetical protein
VHCEQPAGDILLFLTGQDEIDSAQRLLQDKAQQLPKELAALQLMVVPIYAALPPDQQMKAFEPAPEGHRCGLVPEAEGTCVWAGSMAESLAKHVACASCITSILVLAAKHAPQPIRAAPHCMHPRMLKSFIA